MVTQLQSAVPTTCLYLSDESTATNEFGLGRAVVHNVNHLCEMVAKHIKDSNLGWLVKHKNLK